MARLAERQYGVVARVQLRRLGLGRGSIDRRLERGRLHSVSRGVYAVGHANLSRRGHWMAAVLASGPGAVLSHRSAATLFGIYHSRRSGIEVTATGKRHPSPKIEARRGRLHADEVTREDGIPVTTVSRTLFELDGYATHAPHTSFEADRARDRALQVAGWRVVRVTWRQLHAEPARVARDLRALLATPG